MNLTDKIKYFESKLESEEFPSYTNLTFEEYYQSDNVEILFDEFFYNLYFGEFATYLPDLLNDFKNNYQTHLSFTISREEKEKYCSKELNELKEQYLDNQYARHFTIENFHEEFYDEEIYNKIYQIFYNYNGSTIYSRFDKYFGSGLREDDNFFENDIQNQGSQIEVEKFLAENKLSTPLPPDIDPFKTFENCFGSSDFREEINYYIDLFMDAVTIILKTIALKGVYKESENASVSKSKYSRRFTRNQKVYLLDRIGIFQNLDNLFTTSQANIISNLIDANYDNVKTSIQMLNSKKSELSSQIIEDWDNVDKYLKSLN